MEEKLKRLEEWVLKNYSSPKCGYSSERSSGNEADVFEDGMESGNSWAAFEVGQILGMELEEPAED